MTRRNNNLDETQMFFEDGLHIPSRVIYPSLDEDLDEGGKFLGDQYAARIIKSLHILNNISHDPITLIINCPGGDVINGFAVYDALSNSPSPVSCIATGEASSMAAIILEAAHTRYMTPNCRLMFHDGSMELSGTMREVERAVEHERYWRTKTYELLSERTGLKKSFWSRKMAQDWNLTAEEALKYNLIDGVIKK